MAFITFFFSLWTIPSRYRRLQIDIFFGLLSSILGDIDFFNFGLLLVATGTNVQFSYSFISFSCTYLSISSLLRVSRTMPHSSLVRKSTSRLFDLFLSVVVSRIRFLNEFKMTSRPSLYSYFFIFCHSSLANWAVFRMSVTELLLMLLMPSGVMSRIFDGDWRLLVM